MRTFRTKETEKKYEKFRAERSLSAKCPLCSEPYLVEFKHWGIIENKFPYDYIADTHHMILTKRHASEDELSMEEKEEWEALRQKYVNEKYQFIFEPTRKQKSIPGHFHFHLIIAKERSD